MQRRQSGHPKEVQEFIDWQNRQYLGGIWYYGGRLPPRSVMRAGVIAFWWSTLLVAMAIVMTAGVSSLESWGAGWLSIVWTLGSAAVGLGAGVWVHRRLMRRWKR